MRLKIYNLNSLTASQEAFQGAIKMKEECKDCGYLDEYGQCSCKYTVLPCELPPEYKRFEVADTKDAFYCSDCGGWTVVNDYSTHNAIWCRYCNALIKQED